jgi:polynucleotide 5'-kinase involved in rRNA processing
VYPPKPQRIVANRILKKVLILGSLFALPPEEIDGCAVILVCGTQDIGKSTFNRYLINQLLNR